MKPTMSTNTFYTKDHHLDENGIALYVDAIKLERLHALPKDMLHHVQQCEQCKVQIIEMTDIMEEEVFDTAMHHPYLTTAQMKLDRIPWVYRIAAVFIFTAFVGTVYFLVQRNDNNTQPRYAQLPVQKESTFVLNELPAGNASLAENFTPSANLDDLVRTEFRSAAIEVISPENEAIVRSPITFRWKHYGKSLKLKILTNQELELLTSIVQKDSFVTEKLFVPGLYYWKLESESELLFVGKFFVR